MARVRLIPQIIALALFSSTAPAAFANDPEQTGNTDIRLEMIEGEWQFATPPYRNGFCSMKGNLSVFPPRRSENGSLGCALNAVEDCGGKISVVEQACKVSLRDNKVWIESEILNLLQEKIGSTGYASDNFLLDKVSANRMSGDLVSAVTAPAEFHRAEGGIS